MTENIIHFLEGLGVNKAAAQVEFLFRPETLPFALWETVYVTALGTILAYVIGLPLGVILVAGEPEGIRPLPRWLMKALNTAVNLLRSVPFLILMVVCFPLARLIIGTSVGTTASIVPLTLAASPFVARVVESSLRETDRGIIEAATPRRIARLSGLTEGRVEQLAEMLRENPEVVPNGDGELEALDYALASMAIETAVSRHAGAMEETYTMMGQTFVQTGKDLTRVKQIIVTGGSLIHTKRTAEIARHALWSAEQPMSLRPKEAEIRVDRTYIIAAMGLLASRYPQTALRIMKKELETYGYSE